MRQVLSCALSHREKVAGVRACMCVCEIYFVKQCLCAVLFVKCVSEKSVVERCVKNTPLHEHDEKEKMYRIM
jgi:hypothetical protein